MQQPLPIIITEKEVEAPVIIRPYFTEPTPEVLEARRVYDVAIAAWSWSTHNPRLNAELMEAQTAFHKAVQNMLNEFHAALAARDAAFYAAARKK